MNISVIHRALAAIMLSLVLLISTQGSLDAQVRDAVVMIDDISWADQADDGALECCEFEGHVADCSSPVLAFSGASSQIIPQLTELARRLRGDTSVLGAFYSALFRPPRSVPDPAIA